MNQWPERLQQLIERGEPSILITIVEAKGSVPRGAGTKMIVTKNGIDYGTIGGGNLEFQCIAQAKSRLEEGSEPESNWLRELKRFPLGASLGQCCGGVVVVIFEYIAAAKSSWLNEVLKLKQQRKVIQVSTPLIDQNLPKSVSSICSNDQDQPVIEGSRAETQHPSQQGMFSDKNSLIETLEINDFHIVIFGAGHVGKALVHVLGGVDCEVKWVDSRSEEFPQSTASNITKLVEPNPEDYVVSAPVGSYFIVLTHSHHLDQRLCEAILRREDFRLCGLIGSQSKRKKFEHRLTAKGFTPEQVAKLTCPIGIDALTDKQPGHIAVSVAAQLLQLQQVYA